MKVCSKWNTNPWPYITHPWPFRSYTDWLIDSDDCGMLVLALVGSFSFIWWRRMSNTYPILSYPFLSCPTLSFRILSCPVLSYYILTILSFLLSFYLSIPIYRSIYRPISLSINLSISISYLFIYLLNLFVYLIICPCIHLSAYLPTYLRFSSFVKLLQQESSQIQSNEIPRDFLKGCAK